MTAVCQEAVDLVKEAEGKYLTAYKCPAGIWTIGWGHTAGVQKGQSITDEVAERYLASDLENAAAWVDKFVQVPLNPYQRGSLASFVFNLGPGSLQASTLRKLLNKKDYVGASNEFSKWVYADVPGKGKIKLPGLVNRRHAETELFLKEWKGLGK